MRQLFLTGQIEESEISAPIVPRGLSFIYNAFWVLCSERQIENGPIPFTAIDRFATRHGVRDLDQFKRFRVLIMQLDNAYRNKQAAVYESMMRDARDNPPEPPRKLLPKPI